MDVFTLGETMIRFTPKGFTRLEEASELEVRIGGSESNVAIALARLGLRSGWASRLPNNPLGVLTARRIRGFGVDVSHVRWVAGGRMGLYFIEPGAPPRTSLVLYDRAGSAASTMTPDDFDWSLLDSARHVHLTGITPALSPSACATVAEAIRQARSRARTVSFDLNYRARLWTAESAASTLRELIRDVDLLIGTEADARVLFGLGNDPEEAARGLAALTEARYVVVTLSAGGAVLWDRERFYRSEPFPVQTVDRVGAGDAFAAGLLRGYLAGDPVVGLHYGTAMAAIKHTLPGDEFLSSPEEVETLMHSGHRDIQR